MVVGCRAVLDFSMWRGWKIAADYLANTLEKEIVDCAQVSMVDG